MKKILHCDVIDKITERLNLNNQRQCEFLLSDHLVMIVMINGFIVKVNVVVILMFVFLIEHNSISYYSKCLTAILV